MHVKESKRELLSTYGNAEVHISLQLLLPSAVQFPQRGWHSIHYGALFWYECWPHKQDDGPIETRKGKELQPMQSYYVFAVHS